MISLSTLSNHLDTRQTDLVALVHLYRDSTNFVRYATAHVIIDTYSYRGVVESIGQWSEKWNLETDNTVTQSTPSITLRNEQWQDGSGSIMETLFDSTYIGGRAVVLIGFNGMALSSFVTIYDGRIEDYESNGETINVTLKKAELPDTHIGGRKINDTRIGTDNYTANFYPPEEANELYLPVPFGNHWNAPLICYRGAHDTNTYWAYVDNAYDSTNLNVNTSTGVRPLKIQQDNLWQTGSDKTRYVLFVENEDKLVPIYQFSHRGYDSFVTDTDTQAGNMRTFRMDAPIDDSERVFFNNQILANVPLRLYRLSGTGHAADWNNISLTAGGLLASGTDSDIDKMLNDNSADSLGPYYNFTNGTWSEIIFNAIVDIPKQLRSDDSFNVYAALPIHIPQPSDTSGGDQYTILVLGKFTFDGGQQDGGVDNFRSRNYLHAFIVGNDKLTYDMPDPTTSTATWLAAWATPSDWENYIGGTFIGRGAVGALNPNYPPPNTVWENGGQNTGYDYFTHTRLNNAGSYITTGHNRLDFEADSVALNQVADAGNIDDSSPDYAYDLISDEMGSLPMLRRDALDKGVGFRVELRWNDIADSSPLEVSATYEALYLEAFETVDRPLDRPLYTWLKGYTDTNYGDLDSMAASFADETYQYIELVVRRKLGVAAGSMGSEWGYIADAYNDFFGDDRTGSGFVTPIDEDLPFAEWLKEYCQYEPFTVYRDQLGKYRVSMLPIDRTSLTGRSMFSTKLDTVYYKDCDLGFKISLSDKKYLCSQIKECATNFIHFSEDYVEKHEWQITSGSYSYSFWDTDNSTTTNKQFLDKLEKRWTSQTQPHRVQNASDSTKGYCCLVTNEGTSIPLVRSSEADIKYWEPLSGTSTDWGTLTSYTASGQTGHWIGWDAENRAIASYWLNQWCNRHRVITFSSSLPVFLKYEIGDFVRFDGVPDTCLGLDIYGFNKNTGTSATINGQPVYDYFVITRVTKGLGRVEVECMQLHELNQFTLDRTNRKLTRKFEREEEGISSLRRETRRFRRKVEGRS